MNTSQSRRGIFFGLFTATMASMLGMGIVEPILPLYAKHLGASAVLVGIIFAGFALSRSIFAPIIGQLSDRNGRKKFIIIGLILYIIFSIGYVVSVTPWLLIIVRLAQGFASVMVTPIAQSYIGDITPPGKEGKYMNLFFISMFGGTALGPTLGGYFSDRISIDAPFYAMAIMGLISLILTLTLVPESPVTHKSDSPKKTNPFSSIFKITKDKPMLGLMTYMVSRGFSRWGFNTFFPLFAVRILSLSKTGIGVFLSAYMLVGAFLQYPAGILADRYSEYRNELILYGGLLSAIPLFIIPFITNELIIFICVLWMSSLSAFARSSAIAIRTERGRIFGMGTVTGAFTTSMSIGQVSGPILFGVIVDLLNLPAAFITGGLIGLLGAWSAYHLLRQNKKEMELQD